MKNKVWNTIARLPGCKPLPPLNGHATFYLFQTPVDDTGWLVGRYKELTPFATALRYDQGLREFLSKHRIRIGLRQNDEPPAGLERQPRSGPSVPVKNGNKNFTGHRSSVTKPVQEIGPVSVNRRTDREENWRTFWRSQTPQSHHIVEYNNLKTLDDDRSRVGTDEMDYPQLPAVLLAAEFHQLYISKVLGPTRHLGMQQLQLTIGSVYRGLYLGKGPLFEPLWRVSRVILEEAGIKTG